MIFSKKKQKNNNNILIFVCKIFNLQDILQIYTRKVSYQFKINNIAHINNFINIYHRNEATV